MSSRKFNLLVTGPIVLSAVIASLAIRNRTQAEVFQKEAMLRQQNSELMALVAQRAQLSDLVAQTQRRAARQPGDGDHGAELTKLRREVEALRQQTNELARQGASAGHAEAVQSASHFDAITRNTGSFSVVAEDNSEEYATELYKAAAGEGNRFTSVARNLSSAIRAYARQNNGRVPPSLEDAAAYAYKRTDPLAGTGQERAPMGGVEDFELVYQGSLNDLTNVPRQKVALIRQRQAWLSPNGKRGRIYTMADGRLQVVESDDNFQAWEAAHIVPPPPPR